jgi:signal transduction histidine kinase
VRDEAGRILLWVGACIDIDAQKQAEQRLRSADHSKGELLAVLGDELRDPLAPLGSALETLGAQPPGSPDARALAGRIGRQAQLMAHAVDDLLEVARLADGGRPPLRQPCELGALARAAADAAQPELAEWRVGLELAAPAQPLVVQADRRRLALAARHLLRAAGHAADPGTTITLALAPDSATTGALLEVRYRGVGLDAHALDGAPHDGVPAGHRPVGPAAWLGLRAVLIRCLVEPQGGRLEASTDDRRGAATLALRLPPGRPAAPAADGELARAPGTLSA